MKHLPRVLFILALGLAGCASPGPGPSATPVLPSTSPAPLQPSPLPSSIIPPTPLPSATATLQPSVTPRPKAQVCSPLDGVALGELSSIIAGDTYVTPHPGRDDGHPGVDFSFYRRGALTTILGLPVHSALAGRVAAVVDDKKPYGNMILIETPLDAFPEGWLAPLALPTLAPTRQPDSRLTCPAVSTLPAWDPSRRSLYVLYAHLQHTPTLKVGDAVDCGQAIGQVGTTGNSVNPHLHFETRVGPAGVTFSSLGHYDSTLSQVEISSYCAWRVSDWFQVFNPMLLLSLAP